MISQKAIDEMIGLLRRQPLELPNGQTLARGAPKPHDLERAAAMIEVLSTPTTFYAPDIDDESIVEGLEQLGQTVSGVVEFGGVSEEDLDVPFRVECWRKLPERWARMEPDGVRLLAEGEK